MSATDPHLTDRRTPGVGMKDTETQIDMPRMRGYRLARVREQLKRYEYAACVLYDPINIRYATGHRFSGVAAMRFFLNYALVPAEVSSATFVRWATARWKRELKSTLSMVIRWRFVSRANQVKFLAS